jgi:CBS domain-containing protein
MTLTLSYGEANPKQRRGIMVTAMQLMKKNLVTIPASSLVSEAAQAMCDRKIGSVLVQRDDEIIGIATETDIVRRVVGKGQLPGFIAVGTIMSSPIIGIEASRPITEAADLMERNQTRHLVVLKSGRIVGMLSVRDLLHPVSIDEF